MRRKERWKYSPKSFQALSYGMEFTSTRRAQDFPSLGKSGSNCQTKLAAESRSLLEFYISNTVNNIHLK